MTTPALYPHPNSLRWYQQQKKLLYSLARQFILLKKFKEIINSIIFEFLLLLFITMLGNVYVDSALKTIFGFCDDSAHSNTKRIHTLRKTTIYHKIASTHALYAFAQHIPRTVLFQQSFHEINIPEQGTKTFLKCTVRPTSSIVLADISNIWTLNRLRRQRSSVDVFFDSDRHFNQQHLSLFQQFQNKKASEFVFDRMLGPSERKEIIEYINTIRTEITLEDDFRTRGNNLQLDIHGGQEMRLIVKPGGYCAGSPAFNDIPYHVEIRLYEI